MIVASGCGNNAPTFGCPPTPPPALVNAAVACAIADEAPADNGPGYQGSACSAACNLDTATCDLPQSYLDAFNALHAEAGTVDGGTDCPQISWVTLTCASRCTGGRLTEGFATRNGAGSDGERLAHTAWLEAVSVHAFERLERELAAHGAPPALRRDARRARRDEVRHTAMTTRLARRRGVTPAVPDRPSTMRVRPLVELAVENAVEGCVRETYGALLAFVEALSSPDPSLRRSMRAIAEDECRHAELAWSVHAWALPRLRPAERKRVEDALREAARDVPAWKLITAS